MRYCLCVVSFLAIRYACGQAPEYEYFCTASTNLYAPVNDPNSKMFPILGYNKHTAPKLLIGGLGGGVSVFRTTKTPRIRWKGQGNLSRHVYWEDQYLRDNSNNYIGSALTSNTDLTLGLTLTLHYFLGKRFSAGTGLGGQLLLLSVSRAPKLDLLPPSGGATFNHFYKPFIPTIPVEMSLKLTKILLNVRYEYGLINRYKNALSRDESQKISMVTMEVGFKL